MLSLFSNSTATLYARPFSAVLYGYKPHFLRHIHTISWTVSIKGRIARRWIFGETPRLSFAGLRVAVRWMELLRLHHGTNTRRRKLSIMRGERRLFCTEPYLKVNTNNRVPSELVVVLRSTNQRTKVGLALGQESTHRPPVWIHKIPPPCRFAVP